MVNFRFQWFTNGFLQQPAIQRSKISKLQNISA
jgi:hypothetical protein